MVVGYGTARLRQFAIAFSLLVLCTERVAATRAKSRSVTLRSTLSKEEVNSTLSKEPVVDTATDQVWEMGKKLCEKSGNMDSAACEQFKDTKKKESEDKAETTKTTTEVKVEEVEDEEEDDEEDSEGPAGGKGRFGKGRFGKGRFGKGRFGKGRFGKGKGRVIGDDADEEEDEEEDEYEDEDGPNPNHEGNWPEAKEGEPEYLPGQGYKGKPVRHRDGYSQSSDWLKEDPRRSATPDEMHDDYEDSEDDSGDDDDSEAEPAARKRGKKTARRQQRRQQRRRRPQPGGPSGDCSAAVGSAIFTHGPVSSHLLSCANSMICHRRFKRPRQRQAAESVL
jgi:hypothetical protein